MADIVPADLMQTGRVVARFHTRPAEIWAMGGAFVPPLHIGTRWGKRGLFVICFAIGILMAFGQDFLSGWPAWLSWFLPGMVLGLFLSTALWYAMGLRSRRQMAVLGRETETQDVTVTCHEAGLSWATPEITHYLAYDGLDEVKEQSGTILIRYKLFIFYVPPRGFASPEDKAAFIDALRRNVPVERLTGLV